MNLKTRLITIEICSSNNSTNSSLHNDTIHMQVAKHELLIMTIDSHCRSCDGVLGQRDRSMNIRMLDTITRIAAMRKYGRLFVLFLHEQSAEHGNRSGDHDDVVLPHDAEL